MRNRKGTRLEHFQQTSPTDTGRKTSENTESDQVKIKDQQEE